MLVRNYTQGAGSGFLPRIEAIRGLASLSVALHHGLIWLAIGGLHEIWNTPLGRTGGGQAGIARFLISVFNGSAAVTVFFVLSGFVLALSLQKAPLNLRSCLGFWVRRFSRIYPAYAFSIVLIYGYLRTFHPGFHPFTTASTWFNSRYLQPVSLSDVAANLTMRTVELNHVAWTLRIELFFSFLFPALYLTCRYCPPLVNLLFGAAWVGLLLVPNSNPFHFGLMFFLGINICFYGRNLAAALDAANLTPSVAGLLVLLLGIPGLFSIEHSARNDLLNSLAASGLVTLCAYSERGGLFRLLDRPFVRYLGRISFSFYLLNFIVLYILAFQVLAHLDEKSATNFPLLVMLATGISAAALTLPLATVSWYCIEKPFIKLGRLLADAIDRLPLFRATAPVPRDTRHP